MKSIIIIPLVAAIVAGCDPFGSSEREELERERQYQERVRQQELEEKEQFAKGLMDYAKGKEALATETITRLESDLKAAKDDISGFSRIISASDAEKDSKGNPLSPEMKLLNLLRNTEMNELAKKYLSQDFSLVQGPFIDRVKEARASESRYRKALAQSDEVFSATLNDSQKWLTASKKQRDDEIARLQREINSLSRQRDDYQKSLRGLTKNTMVGHSSSERERRERLSVLEQKMKDAEEQILTKRQQIDHLRNPDSATSIESDATLRMQNAQRRADEQRANEQSNINRYYKPKETVADVVADVSGKTVSKLQDAMSVKCQGVEKALAENNGKRLMIKEYILAIPVSSMSELKALRSKLEK